MSSTTKHVYYPHIDEAIFEYCHDKRITLVMFAKKIGCSETAFREKRAGNSSFTVDEFYEIVKMTGKDAMMLLSDGTRPIKFGG